MADDMAIDYQILEILGDNYEAIDNARAEAQAKSKDQYIMNILGLQKEMKGILSL